MTATIGLLLAYLVIILLGGVVISLGISLSKTLTSQEAPYIRSKKSTVDLLSQVVELSPQSRVYELGAGDGRILRTLHSREPQAEYWGVEKNNWPALLFLLQRKIEQRETVYLKKADLFAVDLTGATHIIIYLLTKETERLFPKLQEELPMNSLVYSIDFPLPEDLKTPESTHHSPAGQTIYVYRF